MTLLRQECQSYQGEFDTLAHGGDAFGADFDAAAEMPGLLARLGGAAADARLGPAAASGILPAAGNGDDGVIVLAVDATGIRGFFESADGEQAFDEDFEEFDEAAVFLDGDDEAFVFLAEMLLHELSGLPVHEFAFGHGGAALGFGGFGADFF